MLPLFRSPQWNGNYYQVLEPLIINFWKGKLFGHLCVAKGQGQSRILATEFLRATSIINAHKSIVYRKDTDSHSSLHSFSKPKRKKKFAVNYVQAKWSMATRFNLEKDN